MTAPTTVSDADLLAGLAAVLHEVAGTDAAAVVPEAAFDEDLDVDSLTMVEVVEDLRTVGDALALLRGAAA
jgi:acyl carrier protein